MTMTRRTALALLGTTLARAAARLPANKNVRWALGANLWNSFPRVPFTDILDVMKDTGFIGIRMTQFPQILKTYNITVPRVAEGVIQARLPHHHHLLQRPRPRSRAARRGDRRRHAPP